MVHRIIYTTDLEPINVLDLPIDFIKLVDEHGKAILKVRDKEKDTVEMCRVLSMPLLGPTGEFYKVLVTPDEELALSMEPSWLPGQRPALNFALAGIRKMKQKIIRLMKRQEDDDE